MASAQAALMRERRVSVISNETNEASLASIVDTSEICKT
jgi:hypothetical protein